jgi:hypothetical protein
MKRLLLVMLASCSGSLENKHEDLASLSFDIPAEWQRTDFVQRGVHIAQWAPNANRRRESVAIVRNELSPQVAAADANYLASLLAQSQQSLANARVSAVTNVSTKHGLSGARLSVEFVPPGQTATYHRVHVLLVEDRALFNVIYTAREPNAETLDLVLETIRHQEG